MVAVSYLLKYKRFAIDLLVANRYYRGMKTLSDIYKEEGAQFLQALHSKTGANKKYLYQIAVGLRKPSPSLAKKLTSADDRLSLECLLFPSTCSKKASHDSA